MPLCCAGHKKRLLKAASEYAPSTAAAAAAAASNDVCQGTFFGLFSLNGVVGFALALALLEGAGSSDGGMLWAMAALSALA